MIANNWLNLFDETLTSSLVIFASSSWLGVPVRRIVFFNWSMSVFVLLRKDSRQSQSSVYMRPIRKKLFMHHALHILDAPAEHLCLAFAARGAI